MHLSIGQLLSFPWTRRRWPSFPSAANVSTTNYIICIILRQEVEEPVEPPSSVAVSHTHELQHLNEWKERSILLLPLGDIETTLTVRLPHCVLVGDDGLLGKNKINEAFRVTSYSLPVCVITTIIMNINCESKDVVLWRDKREWRTLCLISVQR